MTSKRRRYSCRGLFKDHNILTLPSLFILSSVRHVVSDRSGFSLSKDGGVGYNLRLNYDMSIPQHRLSFVANSPLIFPIKLYNKLPASLRALGKAKFMNSVKMLLLRHSFYSVAEYLNCADFDWVWDDVACRVLYCFFICWLCRCYIHPRVCTYLFNLICILSV